MSNGLVNNSNSYVSDPVLSLFTILQLDTSRRRMRFPKAFISALETAELDLIIVIVLPHLKIILRLLKAGFKSPFYLYAVFVLLDFVIASEGILYNKCF